MIGKAIPIIVSVIRGGYTSLQQLLITKAIRGAGQEGPRGGSDAGEGGGQ